MTSDSVDAGLDAALTRIHQIAGGTCADSAELQYGMFENWEDAIGRLQHLFEQLTHYAWVDRVEEDGGAMAVVSWKGDFRMVWTRDLSPDQIAQQFSSVDAALRFRAKLILVLAAAARATVSISAALASPVGAVAALASLSKLVRELQDLVSLACV